MTNNNTINRSRKPTTGFFLIRIHQAGIVLRNCCCDHTKRDKYKALKRPFVGKVEKTDTAIPFTAKPLRHCQLVVRL